MRICSVYHCCLLVESTYVLYVTEYLFIGILYPSVNLRGIRYVVSYRLELLGNFFLLSVMTQGAWSVGIMLNEGILRAKMWWCTIRLTPVICARIRLLTCGRWSWFERAPLPFLLWKVCRVCGSAMYICISECRSNEHVKPLAVNFDDFTQKFLCFRFMNRFEAITLFAWWLDMHFKYVVRHSL